MKKSFLMACFAAVAASASAGTWDGAYDATIVSTYADGRVVKVWVNADHTYSLLLPDGKTMIKGTWADANGQSCFTATDPPPPAGAKPVCFPIREHKVGDTYGGEDATGKFTSVVQAGR
jgi:hypothetical protein